MFKLLSTILLAVFSAAPAIATTDLPLPLQVVSSATITLVDRAATLPSCDVVRARLQFRYNQELELDLLLKSLIKDKHLLADDKIQQIIEQQKRSDNDFKELVEPNIQLRAEWNLPQETVRLADLSGDQLAKSYHSQFDNWFDPSGFLPSSLALSIDGVTNRVRLETMQSLEKLCTTNEEFVLTLTGQRGELLQLNGDWSSGF